MYTLGINAAYHELAAALLDGQGGISAVEEERFSGIKHGRNSWNHAGWSLPACALEECLRLFALMLPQVEHIAYSFVPALRMRHVVRSLKDVVRARSILPLQRELELIYLNHRARSTLAEQVPGSGRLGTMLLQSGKPQWRFHYVEHHLAHAASGFLPSPYDTAAVLCIDGIGETTCTLLGFGEGTGIRKSREVRYPHSLGMFYEEVTKYLGFQRNNDEYKVMALAGYGSPRYKDDLSRLVQTLPDGRYRVNVDFQRTGLMGVRELSHLLGPPRLRGGRITERHADIAASAQAVLEDTVLHMAEWLHKKTGSENLCMAGGVALNCVMNERLRAEGPFKRVFVQPAAHDAGTALGAALWVYHCKLGHPREYVMEDAYLGPAFSDVEIERGLIERKIPFRRCDSIAETVAELLAQGKVVGWFQGRMEFGPRALGNRSMLADPRDPGMRAKVNAIKGRENFRPLAPSVLEEEAHEFFECAEPSPFMLFARKVRPEKRAIIPAAVHVDGTARVQTVSRQHNPLFYDLIRCFGRLTGVPAVLNTSLNYADKPIVCTVEQALDCFINSGIDCLAMGPFLIDKRLGSNTDVLVALEGSADLARGRPGDPDRPAGISAPGRRVSRVP